MEEIKAGDIMIGNIITVDNPQYHPKLKNLPLRITGIQERSIQGEIEYCINLEHVNQKTNNYYDTYSQFLKFIRPIRLTEDILLKAGFRKHKMSGYDNHFIYSLFIGGETIGITAIYNADFSIMLHGVARGVKYLHSLQNIIKIVTGNELEINL